MFKLNAYSVGGAEAGKEELQATAPFSAMVIADDTWLRREPSADAAAAGDGADGHGTMRFPDQVDLFYAGPVTGEFGALMQLTYAGENGTLGIDHTDLRFARTVKLVGQDVILGLDANNTPGAQDPWSTISSCNLPFQPGSISPMPGAWPGLLRLAPSVGSIGAYVYAGDLIYAEANMYRSSSQGSPANPRLQGFAPYWRLALTRDVGPVAVQVGGYGMQITGYPTGADPTGPRDHLNDIAADAQVQWIADPNVVTLAGSFINERMAQDASFALGMTANTDNSLKQVRMEVSYNFARKIGISVWLLNVSGSSDEVLYAPAAITGSGTGSPNSSGVAYELELLPWENVKLIARYTAWRRFNGTAVDYDGAGRGARDNDTLTAEAHLMF